jgi:hypothetical protein
VADGTIGRKCQALAEIEDALAPAFVIEELPDGRFTIFVPSIPTPLAGARLHPRARARTSARRALHAGHPIDLAMGVGIERAGGRHADQSARERRSSPSN